MPLRTQAVRAATFSANRVRAEGEDNGRNGLIGIPIPIIILLMLFMHQQRPAAGAVKLKR